MGHVSLLYLSVSEKQRNAFTESVSKKMGFDILRHSLCSRDGNPADTHIRRGAISDALMRFKCAVPFTI